MRPASPHRFLIVFAAALVLALAFGVPAGAHPDREDPDAKERLLERVDELEPVVDGRLAALPCEDGMAGPFPCENVDLEGFVPLAEMGGVTGNDVWGWTDPETGRDYALMGTSNGTAFVDVSEPTDPVVVGILPTSGVPDFILWRDIKVYGDHALVVSEHSGHGMQVFDLTRLRDVLVTPTVFTADVVYSEFSWAHNIAVNPDTGFAYVVGSNTCDGGLHMVDVRDPQNPTFAGCFADDGYTHDVQCVIYDGWDGRFRGREICFASNEDTVTIVDVTDKANPVMLSRTGYETAAYTHQGWLTPDQRWFLFGDELDEANETVPNTTTYIMQLRRLTDPSTPVPYFHDTRSIDHNLYIEGQHVYQSNYTAGLRVLTYDRPSLRAGELHEVGFFDVVPGVDEPVFAGTWSNYPFFDSGIVVVSTIESGLFVLRPHLAQ